MSLTLPLYRLQQIDSRLKLVTTRLVSIKHTLENNAELQAASRQYEEAKANHHQTEKLLKNSEYESTTHRVKLELVEASLYSGRIQNPKELQDLQKEIASLKRNLSTVEDHQLELMMSLEECQLAIIATQKTYEQTQGNVISANASLRTELNSLEKETENLNAQRLAVLPAIDSASLNLYDTLRQKRSGLAVSQVIENACDTCGASLTPGLAQSVRTSSQLVLCPMCGRILYSN